jgi:hypothetical protein
MCELSAVSAQAERVGLNPARSHDGQGSGDGCDGAQQVACHVEQGAADVEVVAIGAVEHCETGDVDGKASGGDPEHQIGLDGVRCHQPFDSFDNDPDGDGEEREAVDEGSQHREAPEAKGAS